MLAALPGALAKDVTPDSAARAPLSGSRSRPTALGFTMSHISVASDVAAACAGGSPVLGGANIISNYQDPAVMAATRSALRAMASQRATVIRDILWYYHSEDRSVRAKGPTDPLGRAVATQGRLTDQILNNLRSYIEDARSAGYERFYLVLGPQGAAQPQCRLGQTGWGQCYNPDLLELDWSVARQVIDATRQVGPGIDVIVDIATEECYAPNSPLLVDKNKEQFTRYMISQYRDAYHDRRFIVSCAAGNGQVSRTVATTEGLAGLMRSLNVRPYAFDIHDYAEDESKATETLLISARAAKTLDVPLIVGETWYDHPNLFSDIYELKKSGQLASLEDVIIWPGRADLNCHPNITLQPPYNMSDIARQMWR